MTETVRVKGDDLEAIFYALARLLSVEDINWLQEHYPQWQGFYYGIPLSGIKAKKRNLGRPFEHIETSSSFDWVERTLRNNYEITLRIKEMVEAKMREKTRGVKTYWLSKYYLVKIAEILHVKTTRGEPIQMRHTKAIMLQAVLSCC